MLEFGKWVRVTKLQPSENPRYPTAARCEWKDGEYNQGVTPPIDYEIIGRLERDVLDGVPMWVDRTERNGVLARGSMTTSPVRAVEPRHDPDSFLVYTDNSLYNVTVLPGEPKYGG